VLPGIQCHKVINVDKNPAFPPAVENLKTEGVLPRRVRLRQCKYLNNVVEQPLHGKATDLAGERLWLVPDGVADLARD
jgi:transposase-like protein